MNQNKPSPHQLAPSVPATTRLYIEAVVTEALRPILKRLDNLEAELKSTNATIHGWTGNLHARMNKYEDRATRSELARLHIQRMLKEAVDKTIKETKAALADKRDES